jgi:hypothetical protein
MRTATTTGRSSGSGSGAELRCGGNCDCTGTGAANVLEPESLRKFINGERVNNAAGNASLHHKVTEARGQQ